METVTEIQSVGGQELCLDLNKPVVNMIKINGESKGHFEQLLKNSKDEVVILARNWNDNIFHNENMPIFNDFLVRSIPLKIILGSFNPGRSPDYLSKYLSISRHAFVKAYVTNRSICENYFRWDDKVKPEYPVIADESMYHIRFFHSKDDSNPKFSGNWYSDTSLNDKFGVSSIRNRFNVILGSPETKPY